MNILRELLNDMYNGKEVDVKDGKVLIDGENNYIFTDTESGNKSIIEGCELYRRIGQLHYGLE